MGEKEFILSHEGYDNLEKELERLKTVERYEIAELEEKIKYARIIDESEVDLETVQVGNKVKLLDIEFNEEVEYTIVGSTEVDLANNKISNESPLGAALIGKRKKDIVEVQAPAGVIKYKIIGLSK